MTCGNYLFSKLKAASYAMNPAFQTVFGTGSGIRIFRYKLVRMYYVIFKIVFVISALNTYSCIKSRSRADTGVYREPVGEKVRSNPCFAANVASFSAVVVILVIGYFSYFTAHAAIRIASVGINVVGRYSYLAARVTVCIAVVVISMCYKLVSYGKAYVAYGVTITGPFVRNFSYFAALVAVCIAIVIVNVSGGSSYFAAITLAVASVFPSVRSNSYHTALVTVGVARVIVNVISRSSLFSAFVTECVTIVVVYVRFRIFYFFTVYALKPMII